MADIVGTDGNDILAGTSGNDTITGSGGNDTIEGGAGDDNLLGGAGNDLLSDSAGGGLIDGGEGDDTIRIVRPLEYNAPPPILAINGGVGNDAIWLDSGDTAFVVDAGAGDDRITLGLANSLTLTLGAGSDRIDFLAFPYSFDLIDFTAGNGGDVLNLGEGLAAYFDGQTNPFTNGQLALQQQGANVAVRFAYNPGGGQFDLLILPNTTVAALTAHNFFGFDPGGGAIAAGVTVSGTALADTLEGTVGADTVNGGDGADSILGRYGNDVLNGDGGEDAIDGQGGVDTIHGGIGNDTIQGGNHADMLYGDGGNDTIRGDEMVFAGSVHADTLDGGDGDDTLIDGGASDIMLGGAGHDTISHAFYGSPTIDGGTGNDLITVDHGSSGYFSENSPGPFTYTIAGGGGDDRVSFSSQYNGTVSLSLGDGNDRLSFAEGFQTATISLGAGTDRVTLTNLLVQHTGVIFSDFAPGNSGDVLDLTASIGGVFSAWDKISNPFASGIVLLEQAGTDVVLRFKPYPVTDPGFSFAIATFQNTTIANFTAHNFGGLAPDGSPIQPVNLTGTAGDDVLSGTVANDTLSGLGGNDTLEGLNGNDTLNGGDGNDSIIGGSGNDLIDGGAGLDTIDGGQGDDIIHGGGDADHITDTGELIEIYGEGGDDTITVTQGRGTIDGGDGNDDITATFYYFGVNHNDAVNGGAGNDVVRFGIGANFSEVQNATIDLGSGDDTLHVLSATGAQPNITLGTGTDRIEIEATWNFGNRYDGSPNWLDIADFVPGNGGDVFDFSAFAANVGDLPAGASPFTGGIWARLVQSGADTLLQWSAYGDGYKTLAIFRNTTVNAFTDHNFGYDLDAPAPPGVTLTALAEGSILNGTAWADSLTGLDGADLIRGYRSNDQLSGGGGNDSILGGDGNDSINGGTGDDGLAGESGNDTINGGDGNDTIQGGTGSDIINGGEGNDTITNGIGSGYWYPHEVNGGIWNDVIDGGAGDDRFYINETGGQISGGTGNDIFETLGSVSAIDGGAGIDTLKFALSIFFQSPPSGFQIDLTGVWTGGVGTFNGAAIQGIERLESFGGTAFNDHYVLGTGYTGPVLFELNMGGGDDYVDTGDVAFIVEGGAGNDHLIGGAMDNGLRGGEGNDLIEGGGGADNLQGDNGNDHLVGGEGDDQLFGLDGADLLEGGNGNDQLYGGNADDTLIGGAGNDLLAIGAGSDNAQGGEGDDTFRIDPGWLFTGDIIDGGAGIDRIQIWEPGGLSFNLSGYWAGLSGTVGGASVSNVEVFEFTLGDAADHIVLGADAPFGQTIDAKGGNDILVGGAGADTFIGGNGNDQLDGGGGDDTIDGGFGDDLLLFGSGTDRFDGGFDNDTLQAVGDGAVLRLRTSGPGLGGLTSFNQVIGIETISGGGFANVVLTGSDTHDAIDFTGITVIGIAAIRGLEGHDQITGSSMADRIEGNEGNDILSGALGDDVLDGGVGDDALNGGGGTDLLFGGLGNDTFHVDSQAELIFENTGEGTDTVLSSAGFYLYQNVENLTLLNGAGSIFGVGNALANTLIGNEGANLLIAGAGNDTVHGGDGGDSLFGEDGDDTLNGDEGIDYIAAGAGNDQVFGGNHADALYGEDGDDYLHAGFSFDTDILVGGAGNDTLFGASGLNEYDLMDGGAGNDIYWVDTGADLTFEAAGGGTDTVHALVAVPNAGVYLYANVENLVLEGNTAFGVGNDLANSLIGSDTPNWLLGGAGNDRIDGRGSNDVLFGQAGADTFVFDGLSGADLIGDFQKGIDKIELNGVYLNFAQAQARFVQVGANGAIDLGGGSIVVLQGVQMNTLTATDFIFG